MRSMKKALRILPALILTVCLFSGVTAHAAAPAAESPDIVFSEQAPYGRRTPPVMDETFDPSVYGEDNASFIYVSVSGNDTAGSGTEDAPYASLQRAAFAAAPGDTIKVSAGTYDLTEPVDIPVGVSLEGEGDDTVLTSGTLTRTDIGGGVALVRLHSEEDPKENGDQHISHIRFDGRQTAAWAIDVSNRHNVSIHDCTIVDFCMAGVGWHATDLSRQSIEDSNPDPSVVNGTFVSGGRFYNNYLKDNTRFAEGWGSGSLFMCGLEGFRVYSNTIIEDVRTSPTGTRGVPLKVWYYAGWMRDVRIHDNDIRRLGSASYSSDDSSGWAFAIEVAPPYAGLEICGNRFVGAVDTNGAFVTLGEKTYDFATWIHDNTWSADPAPKYENGVPFRNEEYAIVLERVTQKTVIEYNTVTGYDTVLYFNGREEISDVIFRNNLCTELGGQSGTMFRLDGRTGAGFSDHITVKDLKICGNVFSSVTGDGASGFGIRLGQEMSCSWSGENIEVSDNVIGGCVYPYWFSIGNDPTFIKGLVLRNNIIRGESGISVPAHGVTDLVNAGNRISDEFRQP